MKRQRVILLSSVALILAITVLLVLTKNSRNRTPQLGKQSVKKVIAAMTLEEKAYLVVGAGMRMGGFGGSTGEGAAFSGEDADTPAGPPSGFGPGDEMPAGSRERFSPDAGTPDEGTQRTRPEGISPGEGGQITPPEGSTPGEGGQRTPSEGFTPGEGGQRTPPEGFTPGEGGQRTPPEGFAPDEGGQRTPPEGFAPGNEAAGSGRGAGARSMAQQGTGEQRTRPQGMGQQGARQRNAETQQGQLPAEDPASRSDAPAGAREGFTQGANTTTGVRDAVAPGTEQQSNQQRADEMQTGRQPPEGFTQGQDIPDSIRARFFGAETATEADTTAMPETVIAEAVDIVAGAAGSTYAIPRLGIPSIILADGPAGLRINPTRQDDSTNTYYCTSFPISTLIASTWDTELAYQVGQAVGNELLEYGVDVLLAPALNIHRNPLCGRNFEYYSEDPFIAGKLTAAIVNGVQSHGVGTSIKHFAANNSETNRMTLNTIVSERALREIYLEGFRIAVQEAQPWTVMSSYNLINGVYASESSDLLTTVLRDDWDFKGFVMTDWGGGDDEAAQMLAGNDLLMPGSMDQAQAIIAAVEDGTLDESILDRNVEKILNMILNSPKFKGYAYSNKPDLEANALLARQVAAEGMVLLRNENATLPLAGNIENIAAFGNSSYNIITGGSGSGDVNEAYSVSLIQGLENGGYTVNSELQELYTTYLEQSRPDQPRIGGFGSMFRGTPTIEEMQVDDDVITNMASRSDVALITVGRNSGESMDRSSDEGDFLLSAEELDMINRVSRAFHTNDKKVIVILNVGGVIETASWRDIPDAILLAWQGGQETGNSITDIISGKVNPSGKLATTFPMKYIDNPSATAFPGTILETEETGEETQFGGFGFSGGSDAEIIYDDGIYVGYRYYETFGILTAYEFGYGLSYTDFTYDNLNLSSNTFKDVITVSIDITNTGIVAGKEVVQLYIKAPDFLMDKPDIELKGFAKTGLLQPGETQTLTFDIVPRSLASFNTPKSSWIAESGTYELRIGASSIDIRKYAMFELEEELVVGTVNKALAPTMNIDELTTR